MPYINIKNFMIKRFVCEINYFFISTEPFVDDLNN